MDPHTETNFMSKAKLKYIQVMDQADKRLENWPMMKTPFPCLGLIVAYIIFLYIGPKIMKNRKAFDLRQVIIPYNLSLVAISTYITYEILSVVILSRYSLTCQLVDYSNDPMAMRMAKACWLYFFSKNIELIDTVLFVLRKKNNQITFLHVFHHTSMIINWYIGARFVPGGMSWLIAALNSIIHVLMYSYYAIAALGPSYQKYLWWKEYMTQFQLIQFFLCLVFYGNNLLTECSFPKGLVFAVFIYSLIMVVLFGNFYYHAYIRKRKSKTS